MTKKPINGANELKKTIQEYVAMTHEIKNRFETDIDSPLAKIDPPQICRPLHDFHVRQCALTHRDFIRKMERESDELRAAEANVNTTLATLEKLRKMLVTNKQQRKTAHKHFRRIANSIQASFQSNTIEEMELEPEPVVFTTDLMNMDASTKQHHRTIARNILDEVNRLLTQLRGQFIVAYQVAHDDMVGKIIQHAEKCRGFIESTLRLAVIEFCASHWFHEQKDAMDQTEYFVSATECAANATVEIQIHTVQDQNLVATIEMDDACSTQIITEEAIQAFEWEQQSLWFDKQADAASACMAID
jgi:hypothetical protein